MHKQLRILQFCNKPPFPPKDGGAIGMHNVSQGILDFGHHLKILSVNSDKHNVNVNELPANYIFQTDFEAVYVDLSIKVSSAAFNLFYSKRSYNITRFYDKALAIKLMELLQNQEFDIVQVESIFLKDYLPIIRKYSNAKVVLRAPNVEFMIWQRLASIEKNPIKKLYLNILAKRLKKEELEVLNKFDAIYTVTERDLKLMQTLGAKSKIAFIPTGIDVTKSISEENQNLEYPSLFHLGALDWMPNQEAVKWLLENVWPAIHQKYPQLKFYIAGRRPPKWMENLTIDGVELVGEVDDAAAFIKSKAIMPVPLFSGSGMRVKIVEAMMLSKAVVSTNIGIEGIIHKNGEDVIIANTAKEFIDAISLLVNDKTAFDNICNNAHKSAENNYSHKSLSQKLNDFLLEIVLE
jgi:glycosyltransferase involved in cell wall biosynthesis